MNYFAEFMQIYVIYDWGQRLRYLQDATRVYSDVDARMDYKRGIEWSAELNTECESTAKGRVGRHLPHKNVDLREGSVDFKIAETAVN